MAKEKEIKLSEDELENISGGKKPKHDYDGHAHVTIPNGSIYYCSLDIKITTQEDFERRYFGRDASDCSRVSTFGYKRCDYCTICKYVG